MRGVGSHAVALQRAQQLAQQQRVAGRGAVAGLDEAVIGRLAEPLAHEVADRVEVERLGPHRDRREVVDELGQQGLDVVALAGAQGRHEQDGQALEPAQQVGEEAQRTVVAPLQVVDGKQQRAVRGEVDGQPVEPVQHGEGPVRALVRRVRGGVEHAGGRGCGSARAATPGAPGRLRAGSKSWRTAPKPNSRSIWLPRAPSVVAPWSAAIRFASPSSRLFPMPDGPSTRASRPWPDHASSRQMRSSASSRSRPTSVVDRGEGRCGAPRRHLGRALGGYVGTCVRGRGRGRTSRLRRGVESRRLRENLRLELAQGTARVDAELVGQRLASAAQGAQRVGLPVRAIEREREQPPALLAQRVAGDQVLQLRHEGRALATVQPGGDLLLVGVDAEPVEPDDLGLDPGLAGEVGVSGTSPQLQRPGQLLGARSWIGQRGRVLQQLFELPGVHRVGVDPQHVARAVACDEPLAGAGVSVGLEPLAQVAEVGVQRARAVAGLRLPPQGVDEPVGGDHVTAGEHEQGQDGALLEPAEVDRLAVAAGRHLAEDADRKRPVGPHDCRPSLRPSLVAVGCLLAREDMPGRPTSAR